MPSAFTLYPGNHSIHNLGMNALLRAAASEFQYCRSLGNRPRQKWTRTPEPDPWLPPRQTSARSRIPPASRKTFASDLPSDLGVHDIAWVPGLAPMGSSCVCMHCVTCALSLHHTGRSDFGKTALSYPVAGRERGDVTGFWLPARAALPKAQPSGAALPVALTRLAEIQYFAAADLD